MELDSRGKPTYVIHENVAWDYIPATPKLAELAAKADAICFGSLAQRSSGSRTAIQACLDAASDRCLRIFDINLRQHYYNADVIDAALRRANVLKLNDEELPVLAKLLGIAGSEQTILVRCCRLLT